MTRRGLASLAAVSGLLVVVGVLDADAARRSRTAPRCVVRAGVCVPPSYARDYDRAVYEIWLRGGGS